MRSFSTARPEKICILFIMNIDQSHLRESLSRLLSAPVKITLTDNTSSMIHARKLNGVWTIRLHHMFTTADQKIHKAVSRFLLDPTDTDRLLLQSFIQTNATLIKTRENTGHSRKSLITSGYYHDLHKIMTQLAREYFSEPMSCAITWGRKRKSGAIKTIRLGSYCNKDKIIRVHPSLDQWFVPRYFVKGVVYHEMLHHIIPVPHHNGRRIIHPPLFKQLERSYPDYERIQQWKRKNLARLMNK